MATATQQNATRNQLFALWSDTGRTLELRNMGDKLSLDTAKSMLSRMRDQGVSPTVIHAELLELGAELKGAKVISTGTTRTWEPKLRKDWQAVYNEADQAGKAAAAACKPTPMVVQQHANPMNDRSAVVQQWVVPHGSCGFAWIKFKGNTAWAAWTKKKGLCGDAYPSGRSIWVSDYGQSIELKYAYAAAFANVLRTHGVECYAQSRDD